MESIQFISVTPEQLENKILQGVKSIFAQFSNPEEDKLLSRKETAEFFQVDLVTIHNWTKKKKLRSHQIGNRVYYKKIELLECLTEVKR